MNEKKAARDLGEILGDIDRHCTQAEQSSVPANAETLLRLLLDAAKHLPAIQATANLAHAEAIEAQRVARDVAGVAYMAVEAAKSAEAAAIAARDAAAAKAPTKTSTTPKKAA